MSSRVRRSRAANRPCEAPSDSSVVWERWSNGIPGASPPRTPARPWLAQGPTRPADAIASVAAAPFEVIFLVCKEDVEAGQGSVAAADVALQLHLHVVGQIGRIDVLLDG